MTALRFMPVSELGAQGYGEYRSMFKTRRHHRGNAS